MTDQLDLFAASPPPPPPAAAGIPTGRDYLAMGLTPRQGFARRYPAAMRIRGMAIIDLVASGLATPAMRAEFDAWYRERWRPVDFHLAAEEHLNNPPKQARDTTHAPAGALER